MSHDARWNPDAESFSTSHACDRCGDTSPEISGLCFRCLLADRADSDAVSRRLETETAWLAPGEVM